MGRDFDHLILLRAPSSRVEGQRVVTAIEWSERNKRIVGRAYVVEGQQRPNATGYFWKDLAAGVEGVLGELDLEMIDVDSAMTEMGPALEQIKKMGPQFEQMGKTLREKLSTLPQQLKGNKGKFSVKYIRDGQPSSTTTTIVHKGEKDTIIVIDPSDESSFFVDPSTVDETTIEAKNGYFLRFPFFADRFTGENNAYNQRLLNQFIDQGTPLLPYMDAGQLSATLQMCGKLMKKLTSKPGTTKMIARLTDYIQRCSDQLAEGRFTYHDSDADTPSAGT
ncbi:MAG: hypothetical protein HUK09_07045 [Bacteroidaceae bacterium]|nr:hypothetical protein [Bacteroidaceae bacterium]